MNDSQIKTSVTRAEAERLQALALREELSLARLLRKIVRDWLREQEAAA